MSTLQSRPGADFRPSFPPDADHPRVLIVDDEFVIAMLIRDMIRKLGYGVSGFANDLYSTRDKLAKHDFDAVLLSLTLGRQHSPEIADLLIKMKVPITFLTWHAQPYEPRHAKVPTLHKPLTAGKLRKVLYSLVGPPRTSERMRSAG